MFDELHELLVGQMTDFSDSINDDFGLSILSNVYEPLMDEIVALRVLEDFAKSRTFDINLLTEELQTI